MSEVQLHVLSIERDGSAKIFVARQEVKSFYSFDAGIMKEVPIQTFIINTDERQKYYYIACNGCFGDDYIYNKINELDISPYYEAAIPG